MLRKMIKYVKQLGLFPVVMCVDSLSDLQVSQAIYTHNNTKIAEINALYLHIISILFALFKAIFQLFILLKLKKGYECSLVKKAAQLLSNGEQLLKF